MKSSKSLFISMTFLITSNVLGVGILALPIKTGLSGFFPTVLGVVGIWALMCFTALIIAKRIKPAADGSNTFDIPSFFHDELGHVGRWIAIVANLILLYGVLTAYLSMISSMIYVLFPSKMPQWTIILIYFIVMSCLTLFGMKILSKSNKFIIYALWFCFAILLIYAVHIFKPHHLLYTNWVYFPIGLPIAISAFHFHNIIPTVCRNLKYDLATVRKAILTGTGIGLVMNLVWVMIVLGGLPETGAVHTSIAYSASHGDPATVPLSLMLHSNTFTVVGAIFALLAVSASYMANGTGTLGFVRDLAHSFFKWDRTLVVDIITFAPPLILALTYPQGFLTAISIVGGVGETILFGILPAIILLKYAHRNQQGETRGKMFWAYVALGISLYVFVVAIAEQAHFNVWHLL